MADQITVTQLLKHAYWAARPTPKRVKEEFLSLAQEKVDHYKPMIEERSGINLGHVAI